MLFWVKNFKLSSNTVKSYNLQIIVSFRTQLIYACIAYRSNVHIQIAKCKFHRLYLWPDFLSDNKKFIKVAHFGKSQSALAQAIF